jgi:hypothetical protein
MERRALGSLESTMRTRTRREGEKKEEEVQSGGEVNNGVTSIT